VLDIYFNLAFAKAKFLSFNKSILNFNDSHSRHHRS
jgi:hypothetical protein